MPLANRWTTLFIVGALCALVRPDGAEAAPYSKLKEKHDLYRTTEDGVNLRAYLLQPVADGKQSGLMPAIILANPWAMPSELYLLKARQLAFAGYVVLGYSSRGFGGSGGAIDAAGSKDLNDMSAWIDWLVAHAGVDPERIGIAGISYGGALAVMAATHDERIKAVVTLSGWVDIGHALLYEDGTVPGAWGNLLLGLARAMGHMDEYTMSLIERGRAYQLSQEEMGVWAAPRSPVNYLDRLNARGVPIMIQHCLDDNLFWPTRTIAFYNQLTGPKKLILNLGEHSTSDFMGAFGVDNKVWDRLTAWFDLYLKGQPSPLFATEKPITVPIKRAKRELSLTSWPDGDAIQQVSYAILPDATQAQGVLKENGARIEAA